MKRAVKEKLDELLKENFQAQEIVIPVVEETVVVDKEVFESEKIFIRKTIKTENVNINIPLINDVCEIHYVPSDKVFDSYPLSRQVGDTMIIPIVKEILVIKKKYQMTQEIHVTKIKTSTPFLQQIELKKEQVKVERNRKKL